MDASVLIELGFSIVESRLYLELVRQQPQTVQQIAKRLGIPRTTAHSALDSLRERRFVERNRRRGTSFYSLTDPEVLADAPRALKEASIRKMDLAKALIDQIRPLLRGANPSTPRVHYAEGRKQVENFLDGMIDTWKASIIEYDHSTWGYQDPTFVRVFRPWLSRAWKKLHEDSGIAGCLLSHPDSAEEELVEKVTKRNVRVLPRDLHFDSSLWVMGRFVVLIMTKREPVYLLQLDDTLFADTLRSLFRYLYDQASPLAPTNSRGDKRRRS